MRGYKHTQQLVFVEAVQPKVERDKICVCKQRYDFVGTCNVGRFVVWLMRGQSIGHGLEHRVCANRRLPSFRLRHDDEIFGDEILGDAISEMVFSNVLMQLG